MLKFLSRLVLIALLVGAIAPALPSLAGDGGDNNDEEGIPLIGGVEILSEQPGVMVNMGYINNQGNCSNAAMSYLSPEMEVEVKLSTVTGNFITVGALSDQDLSTYLSKMFLDLSPFYNTLASAPKTTTGPALNTPPVKILDAYTCKAFKGGIAMFWKAEYEGQQGWVLESILWNNFNFATYQETPVYNPNEIVFQNPNQEPDLNNYFVETVMDSLVLHFLAPYVKPLSPNELGAIDLSGFELPEPKCEYGAPSSIDVGDYVVGKQWAYKQMAVIGEDDQDFTDWDIYDQKFDLDEDQYAKFEAFAQSLDMTVEPNIGSEYALPAILLAFNFRAYEGPICTSYEWNRGSGTTSHVVATWWNLAHPNIEAGWNGYELVPVEVLETGYYMENMALYNNTPKTFDDVEFWYFLGKGTPIFGGWEFPGEESAQPEEQQDPGVPKLPLIIGCRCNRIDDITPKPAPYKIEFKDLIISSNQPAENNEEDTCDEGLPSRLQGGDAVHPALLLNVRDVPMGEVVNRLAPEFTFFVSGDPVCEGGMRWWLIGNDPAGTPFGWAAENDASTYFLMPGRAPVSTPEATPIVEETPPPSTAPTQEPTQAPTTDPTTGGSTPPTATRPPR